MLLHYLHLRDKNCLLRVKLIVASQKSKDIYNMETFEIYLRNKETQQ